MRAILVVPKLSISLSVAAQPEQARPSKPHGIFIALFPGLFIFLTVLCANFLGDGLRDALDPWHYSTL